MLTFKFIVSSFLINICKTLLIVLEIRNVDLIFNQNCISSNKNDL